MPLVTSTEMFKKAYEGHYAVGAFNVNNMEIIQGIVMAAQQEHAPLILQVSAGARKYASHIYLTKAGRSCGGGQWFAYLSASGSRRRF
jgi:fructose-bisphosphate aldolase class II